MFGLNDLESEIIILEDSLKCPIKNCTNYVKIQKGKFSRTTPFYCPKHCIYISPSTFEYKYEKDNLGMTFARKEKVVFRIFKWLAIISVVCNIICIWAGMGKSNQVLATVMEVLFLGAIVFAYFMNLNLFAQYSIIYVEGHNLTTKERVVLVLPPGAKSLMPEEEFKKKMPFFYE